MSAIKPRRTKPVAKPVVDTPAPAPPMPPPAPAPPEVPAGPGCDLRTRMRSMPRTESCDYPWSYILNMVLGSATAVYDRINMDPDYQRGHVWIDRQASLFLGHVLDGGDIPKIYLQRYDSQANVGPGEDYLRMPMEIIDGKQRLQAIARWMRDEIPALCHDSTVIWYRDTSIPERRSLMLRLYYVDLPRAARLRFYLRLNRGGSVHTDGEIARVEALLAAETGSAS